MTDEKDVKKDEAAEEAASDESAEKAEVKGEAPAAEDKKEEAPEAETETEVEVPKEFKEIVEKIEKMSVLELNELVKVLEKKFGVSAVAVAAAPAAGEGAAEEKSSFNVELAEAGGNKIAVIKVVKEISGLGLKEAKDLVEGVPTVLKEGVKAEEAEEMKTKLEEAGAKVNLK